MPSPSSNYPWLRRWRPISSDIISSKNPYKIDNSGYVVGTEWGPGLVAKPLGVTLDQLGQDLMFAVLLGEPGIGKTNEWKKLRDALKGLPEHLFIDLGSFTTEDILYREIVGSSEIEGWLKNDFILTLWLDSLDEGMLHISKLQEGILRILRKLPIERLRLRITCRNAVWPVTFFEALQNLWILPKETSLQQSALLLLSPLTQQQVKEAAEQEGFNVDKFL